MSLLPTRPAAVLWDFDGTLLDTENYWVAVEREIFAERGVPWIADREPEMIGLSIERTSAMMAAALNQPDLDQPTLRDLIVDRVAARIRDNDLPYLPGVRELLGELREAGIACALVSASPTKVLAAALDRIGPDVFDVIVSGADVRRPKPAPDAYALAAIKLGFDASDCLAIEDSRNGCLSASRAGAAVLAVPNMVELPDIRHQVIRPSLAGVTLADLSGIHAECMRQRGYAELQAMSGVRTGVLRVGERAALTDIKGRRHSIVLKSGARFHTTRGAIEHDDMIGHPEGITVTSVGGLEFLVTRNVMREYMVSMHREAAIVYPKDAAAIVVTADIFPGARVLEAGAGSGALSLALLRAVGPAGTLISYERRPAFADRALNNVSEFFSVVPDNWLLVQEALGDGTADAEPEDDSPAAKVRSYRQAHAEQAAAVDDGAPVDRVVLDMLAPWEVMELVAERLVPGGIVCCYATTTPQMARIVETIRSIGGFTDPLATETTERDWHVEGLSVRPEHGVGAHTGFLVTARRLAPGARLPRKRRRGSSGAYGPDYHGPRPAESGD